MKQARILLMLLVIAFFVAGYAFGQEVPKGVKVAGSPEVMPTQAEIIKAIPPSLKALGKGKTIRIMFQGGGDSAPPLELKELIEKETGLKLTIDVIPPENLHERQLAFLLSGAAEYDLLELYPTWIGEYAEADYIENLDALYKKYGKEIDVSDFIEGAQVGFDKYKGSWYAVPYDGDVNIFYYRKDLFADAKNKADFKAKYKYNLGAPNDWDQVRDMAEFFTGRQPGLYGFGTLALKTWWAVDYWANVYRNRLAADGVKFSNGLVNDNGEIELNKDAFIKANDFYMALMKFSPPGILSWGYPETKEGIGNGVVAMTMQWATSVFRDPRQAKYWDQCVATIMPGFKQQGRQREARHLLCGRQGPGDPDGLQEQGRGLPVRPVPGLQDHADLRDQLRLGRGSQPHLGVEGPAREGRLGPAGGAHDEGPAAGHRGHQGPPGLPALRVPAERAAPDLVRVADLRAGL